jgi:phytoene dehydrogenase-like protein
VVAARDVIIVGAGHNGLVAASYLARAGKDVLVLERRGIVGGACVTEELIPGARFSTCAYVVASLRPQIIGDLGLVKHGLELYTTDVLNFVMGPSGESFFVWPELDRTVRELERLGRRDADSFIDFGARFKRFAKIVEPYLLSEPPQLSELIGRFEALGEIELWHEFVSLSVGDMLDRYFDSDLLKGFFMFFALASVHAGPHSPGTAYEFSHHSWGEYKGEFGRFAYARGGMGAISEALAQAATRAGVEIRTSVEVDQIVLEHGAVRGVRVRDGEVFAAPVVLSNADPKHTYLSLLRHDAVHESVRTRAQQIDMRGSMARVHILVDELPQYIGLPSGEGPQHRGFTLVGGMPTEYERCWEAQQRGELTDNYPIELIIQSTTDPTLAPPGLHTLTTGIQHLPFRLSKGDWDSRREEFTERVIASLLRFAPNLGGAIRGSFTVTPLDLEREYGLSEGNIFHGAMFVNQLFASRPLPGLGGYRTPVNGLYLCGAGTHPGGGVMGAAGHNAAAAVLRDLHGIGSARDGSPAEPKGDLTYRLATSGRLRPLRNWAIRQKAFRRMIRGLTNR